MHLTAVYIVSMDPYGNSGMILKKKRDTMILPILSNQSLASDITSNLSDA